MTWRNYTSDPQRVTVAWRSVNQRRDSMRLVVRLSKGLLREMGWPVHSTLEAMVRSEVGLLRIRLSERGNGLTPRWEHGGAFLRLPLRLSLPPRLSEPTEFITRNGAIYVTLPLWATPDRQMASMPSMEMPQAVAA